MLVKAPTLMNEGGAASGNAAPAQAEQQGSLTSKQASAKGAEPSGTVKEFKINGKSVKVDLSNPAEVEKLVSLGLASNDKFQEAAKLRKEAEDILAAAKTKKSATEALKKAGFDSKEIKEILEKELAGFYEEEALSPEEKQRRAEMEELRKYKEEEARKKDEEAKSAKDKEVEAEMQALEEELLGALSKSNLPRTPVLAKWAVQYMSAYDAQGIQLSADQAVKIVEREFPQLVQSVLSTMDVQGLKQFLGKSLVKQLLDDSVKAVKQAEAPFTKEAKQTSREASQSSSKPKQKMVMSDYFEKLRRGEI
jgi:DNA-binding transcriptional MerR regulator